MQKHIPTSILQTALNRAGNYTITEADGGMHHTVISGEKTKNRLQTYKPVLLIFGYLLVISSVAAINYKGSWEMGMRIFMAGFFLTFSFFKMLDLAAFADNYSRYDIIAKRFRGWGYIYAFTELLSGIAYAINFQPLITNTTALAVMLVSIMGVLQSVLNKQTIQCACLGAVFNLPMSTITIIEDALMIVMSGIMLVSYLV